MYSKQEALLNYVFDKNELESGMHYVLDEDFFLFYSKKWFVIYHCSVMMPFLKLLKKNIL